MCEYRTLQKSILYRWCMHAFIFPHIIQSHYVCIVSVQKYIYTWLTVLANPAQIHLTHPTLVVQWSCYSSLQYLLLNRCKCQCLLQWCWGGSDCSPVSCCPTGLCWWSLWEVLPGPQPHCGARWWWREGSCPQCSSKGQGLERLPLGWLRWQSQLEQLHRTGNNEWCLRTSIEDNNDDIVLESLYNKL